MVNCAILVIIGPEVHARASHDFWTLSGLCFWLLELLVVCVISGGSFVVGNLMSHLD